LQQGLINQEIKFLLVAKYKNNKAMKKRRKK